MAKRKVVLTGACGHVSGRMLDALRERYDPDADRYQNDEP